MSLIAVESLNIRYGERLAVRNATLNVPQGKVTAIVGPSGCGKSSLLMALNRLTDLLPGAEVSGQIRFQDEDIRAPATSPVSLRRRIGMLFQKPTPFPMSIRRNLQLALQEHGVRQRTELEAVTERVLRDVGLWDEVARRLDESALQLSGGQQQRLCLARALALEPDALLMDEPCSALDPLAAARIEDLIRELTGRYTIVIVTHNLAQARRIADQAVIFWFRDGAGEIVEQGPAAQVFDSPQDPDAAAYLQGARG